MVNCSQGPPNIGIGTWTTEFEIFALSHLLSCNIYTRMNEYSQWIKFSGHVIGQDKSLITGNILLQPHHERLYNVYKKFYSLFSKLTVIYWYVNINFFNWIRQKPLLRGIPGCYATSNLTGLRNRTGTIHGRLGCRASPLLKLPKGRFAWESRLFWVMPSDCLEVSGFWPRTCSPDHFNSSFRQKKMQVVFVLLL